MKPKKQKENFKKHSNAEVNIRTNNAAVVSFFFKVQMWKYSILEHQNYLKTKYASKENKS